MSNLLKSRKFWLAVLDAVLATLAISLGWFFAPDKVEEIMKLVLIWQPVIILVIISYTVEDSVAKAKGSFPYWPEQ